MLNVRLNGEDHAVPADASLLDLLSGLGKDPRVVAIELNGSIVPRGAFGDRRLAAGDRIEIVEFVQGGDGRGESEAEAKG